MSSGETSKTGLCESKVGAYGRRRNFFCNLRIRMRVRKLPHGPLPNPDHSGGGGSPDWREDWEKVGVGLSTNEGA